MNDLIEKYEKNLTSDQVEAFKPIKDKLSEIDWTTKENEMRMNKLIEANNQLLDTNKNLMDNVLKKISPAEDKEQKKTSDEAAADLT